MIFKITKGFNRYVILIGNYAAKLPRNTMGLTSNANEAVRWKHDFKRRNLRCPVIYGSSFIVIMKRCQPCPTNIFEELSNDFKIIDDFHQHNFGILTEKTVNGYEEKVVCLDYGNNLVFSNILMENKNLI